MHYFLNIGSNLGNRRLNISRAVRRLEQAFGYFEISKAVETEPWGYESPNRFMNVAVMVISELAPGEMLAEVKRIERSICADSHRDARGGYADRVIDIDIMAADEIQIDSDELKIPHPALRERDFFLIPFAELAPGWRHPATGETCGEMLATLTSEGSSEP